MAHFDAEFLLAPLDGPQPCGPNLEYDADTLALESAARGKPEQQYGDTIIAAEAPDWRDVEERAAALLRRTRDLRIAMTWLRARTRLDGLGGFAGTLAVIAGWVERYWDDVHPQLDPDDGHDPTMRLNALAPLTDVATVLSDLRAAPVAAVRGAITVREVEIGLGKATPLDGETAPSETGVHEALRAVESAAPGSLDAIDEALGAARALEATLTSRVGSASPDLKPLVRPLLALAQAAGVVRAAAADGESASPGEIDAPASRSAAAGGLIRNRADAARQLEAVCDWLERNEPANPAPILVRRAVRVMSMSFIDIVRDLAPEGAPQVERLAGSTQ